MILDLTFNQTIIKYQTRAFLEECGLDFNDLYVSEDKVYYNVDPDQDGMGRVLVPPEMRLRLIQTVHSQRVHPGQNKTVATLKEDYYWPKMTADAKRYVKACETCQKVKSSKIPKYHHLKLPVTARLKTLHMDVVGPVKRSKGQPVFLITMIDRFTRFSEAAITRQHKASTIKTILYNYWISRYGPPHLLITDNGPEFRSEEFNRYLRFNGIEHRYTTPYHPQTNGMVERMHGTLKAMIRAHQLEGRDWVLTFKYLSFCTSHCY